MNTPALDTIHLGDVLQVLKSWPDECVHTVVTSPPYWGLRNYGVPPSVWGGTPACPHEWVDTTVVRKGSTNGRVENGSTLDGAGSPKTLGPGESNDTGEANRARKDASALCSKCGAWRGHLGLEPTPFLFVEHLVEVFREVRRVLRPDGTCWLNMGDSYVGSWGEYGPQGERVHSEEDNEHWHRRAWAGTKFWRPPTSDKIPGLKEKDLALVPFRLAIALQDDGWWVRSDIIWYKRKCMPESVSDRPTKAHEYVFLLSKSQRYFFDMEAVKEPCASGPSDIRKMEEKRERLGGKTLTADDPLYKANKTTNIGRTRGVGDPSGRNIRTVWDIAPTPFKGLHFAVFPEELVERCVAAGTSEKGACSACGAPWARLTKSVAGWDDQGLCRGCHAPRSKHIASEKSAFRVQSDIVGSHGSSKMEDDGAVPCGANETTGWTPTCECNATVKPCVVLDTFSGSGTTAKVATRMGRQFLAIDLNPEYVKIGTDRCAQELSQGKLL